MALRSRAEMQEEDQREMKRKAERGVQLKHMLKMDKDQCPDLCSDWDVSPSAPCHAEPV